MDAEGVKNLLAGVLRPTLFEVGSNDGSTTVSFLKAIPNVLLTSFEPDERAYINQMGNPDVTRAVCEKRMDLQPLALCNVDGRVTFHSSYGTFPGEGHDQWNKSGSLLQPKEHLRMYPWCKFDNKGSVVGVRLDTFMKERLPCCPDGHIDFMWADVQGAERLMIEGGRRTFDKRVHYLYTEYSNVEIYSGAPGLEEICALLPGYELIIDEGSDALFHNLRYGSI